MLIQSFQTLLAQHLEVLHKIIVSSVTHQEQQLNAIEEHMKSFLAEQDMVTIKSYLSKLTFKFHIAWLFYYLFLFIQQFF